MCKAQELISVISIAVTAGRYNDPQAWRIPVSIFVDVVLASLRD